MAKKSEDDKSKRKAAHAELQRKKKRLARGTIVDRAMLKMDCGPAEFARKLEKHAGMDCTRQMIDGWSNRGVFPPRWMIPVAELTGLPLADVMNAKPRTVDKSIVERAIRIACPEDPSSKAFAALVSKVSGRTVNANVVNEWRRRERIPAEYAAYLTKITRIPLQQFLDRDLVR